MSAGGNVVVTVVVVVVTVVIVGGTVVVVVVVVGSRHANRSRGTAVPVRMRAPSGRAGMSASLVDDNSGNAERAVTNCCRLEIVCSSVSVAM